MVRSIRDRRGVRIFLYEIPARSPKKGVARRARLINNEGVAIAGPDRMRETDVTTHPSTGVSPRARFLARLLRRARGRRARAKLRIAEAKYRTLVEQLPLVTYIDALTPTATSLYASPQVEALLGYGVEEWLSDPEFFAKILHPDDREHVLALVDECNRTGKRFDYEYRLIARDGRAVWVQDESLIVFDDRGQPLFTQGYLLDITARKESERRLAAEHGVARVLAEAETLEDAAPDMLRVICDALSWEGGVLWLVDRDVGNLSCARTHGKLEATDPQGGLAGEVWTRGRPVWRVDRSGVNAYGFPISLGRDPLGILVFQARGLQEPDDRLTRTLGIVAGQVAQFIERKQAESQLRHQALHDGLTGLPNRALFNDRLSQALAMVGRSGVPLAVLLMDLDSFKEINDTLGHHSGDALLEELGERLETCVRAGDTVARLGGDEFGFLLLDVSPSGAVEVVDRIRQALAEPFRLQGLTLQVEASIGIALFPEHGESADLLLRRADVAMYVAKRSGAAFAFYDSAEDEHTPIRLAMVGELRRAIDEHELVLHYQPEVMLDSGAVRGVEALLRWEHPTRGLLLPAEFLPAAEKTGLMDALTRYVLDEALRQRLEWSLAGHKLNVAVNVSMRNLLDNELPGDVAELLERREAPASCLEFEITEHTVVADRFRARAVLERLNELGLRVAIDDFGTSYSSLAYLRRLPLHKIKIDRSFVSSMTQDPHDVVIVRSTVDLARSLGLDVVAQGVESEEIYNALVELGCDAVQGNYLCGPLRGDELALWLDRRVDTVATPAQPLAAQSAD
jgi:diguanylate cyclase (GGDEF)-like protein/PAS domain S-box-containing protein